MGYCGLMHGISFSDLPSTLAKEDQPNPGRSQRLEWQMVDPCLETVNPDA